MDRPQGILKQKVALARTFAGDPLTETLLVRDLNDSKANLQALVTYLALLDPNTALPPGAYPPAGRPQLLLDQRIAEGRLSAVRHQGRVFYLKAILPPRAAPVANRR